MSQKVREIVTIVFGFISGANAIYQLLFRQDIALFIVNAIVAGTAFFLIMNHFFGFEQWEPWQKSVVQLSFIFGLVPVVNRYLKK